MLFSFFSQRVKHVLKTHLQECIGGEDGQRLLEACNLLLSLGFLVRVTHHLRCQVQARRALIYRAFHNFSTQSKRTAGVCGAVAKDQESREKLRQDLAGAKYAVC